MRKSWLKWIEGLPSLHHYLRPDTTLLRQQFNSIQMNPYHRSVQKGVQRNLIEETTHIADSFQMSKNFDGNFYVIRLIRIRIFSMLFVLFLVVINFTLIINYERLYFIVLLLFLDQESKGKRGKKKTEKLITWKCLKRL